MHRLVLIFGIIGLVVGLFVGAWVTSVYKNRTISEMQLDYANDAKSAAEKMLELQKEYNLISNELDISYAENREKIDALLSANRKLSGELGGLRDPGRVPKRESTGCIASASAASRLSGEASGFLLEFARDADRSAEYARTCHEWTSRLRAFSD